MARFTIHKVTADYKEPTHFVGCSWIVDTAWDGQDLVDKLRLTRPDLCNFKITSTGYGLG
jgi:hypothetical protein